MWTALDDKRFLLSAAEPIKFDEEGYDSPNSLLDMTTDELGEELGMKKGHARRLQVWVEKIKRLNDGKWIGLDQMDRYIETLQRETGYSMETEEEAKPKEALAEIVRVARVTPRPLSADLWSNARIK